MISNLFLVEGEEIFACHGGHSVGENRNRETARALMYRRQYKLLESGEWFVHVEFEKTAVKK